MTDDAVRRYEQMLAEDPQSRAFAPLAEAHRKAGRLDEAIKVARAGLEVHPGYSGGLVVLGRALYEKGELDNAAETLTTAVTETPESYLGQKFLGKVLIDKGDSQGAMKALEAAHMLSPEDEEVARLIEEVRSKATPPETMEYRNKGAEAAQEAQIVTYEQKPTTIDGVELPPLQKAGGEETFSFSGGGTDDPADVTPVEAVDEPPVPGPAGRGQAEPDDLAEEEMTATVIEETDVEQTMEVGSLDELGPEAAAFIMEAESADEISMDDIPSDAPVPTSDPPADAAGLSAPAPAPVPEPEPVVEPPVPSEPVPAPEAAPEPVFAPEPGFESPAGAVPEPAPEPVFETPVAAEPPSAAMPEPAPGPAPEPIFDPQAPSDPVAPPQPPAPPEPENREAEPASPEVPGGGQEFSTETMADLYAQQGLVEKAVAIYRQILAQDPDNEIVRLKLDALQDFDVAADDPQQQNMAPREPEPGPAPQQAVPEPAAPSPPVSGTTEASQADSGNDEKLSVLEKMLENAERMKRS